MSLKGSQVLGFNLSEGLPTLTPDSEFAEDGLDLAEVLADELALVADDGLLLASPFPEHADDGFDLEPPLPALEDPALPDFFIKKTDPQNT